MNRSFGFLGALALSLTMFACSSSGAVGHGARPAPGPEAFGLTDESAAVKTANGALPAPGVGDYRAPQLTQGAQAAPGPRATVESAAR